MSIKRGLAFDQLSERQRAACHAFNKQWGISIYDVAEHLNAFFRLSRREITEEQFEQETGLMIRDTQTLRMF